MTQFDQINEVLDDAYPYTMVEKDVASETMKIWWFEDVSKRCFSVRMMRPEKNEVFEARVGVELKVSECNPASLRVKETAVPPSDPKKFYATVLKIIQEIINTDPYASKKKCYMMAIPSAYYDRLQRFALRVTTQKLRAAIGNLYFEDAVRTTGRNTDYRCMFMGRRGFDMDKIIKPNVSLSATSYDLDQTVAPPPASKSVVYDRKESANMFYECFVSSVMMLPGSQSAKDAFASLGSVRFDNIDDNSHDILKSIKHVAIAYGLSDSDVSDFTKLCFLIKKNPDLPIDVTKVIDSLNKLPLEVNGAASYFLTSANVKIFLGMFSNSAKTVLFNKCYDEYKQYLESDQAYARLDINDIVKQLPNTMSSTDVVKKAIRTVLGFEINSGMKIALKSRTLKEWDVSPAGNDFYNIHEPRYLSAFIAILEELNKSNYLSIGDFNTSSDQIKDIKPLKTDMVITRRSYGVDFCFDILNTLGSSQSLSFNDRGKALSLLSKILNYETFVSTELRSFDFKDCDKAVNYFINIKNCLSGNYDVVKMADVFLNVKSITAPYIWFVGDQRSAYSQYLSASDIEARDKACVDFMKSHSEYNLDDYKKYFTPEVMLYAGITLSSSDEENNKLESILGTSLYRKYIAGEVIKSSRSAFSDFRNVIKACIQSKNYRLYVKSGHVISASVDETEITGLYSTLKTIDRECYEILLYAHTTPFEWGSYPDGVIIEDASNSTNKSPTILRVVRYLIAIKNKESIDDIDITTNPIKADYIEYFFSKIFEYTESKLLGSMYDSNIKPMTNNVPDKVFAAYNELFRSYAKDHPNENYNNPVLMKKMITDALNLVYTVPDGYNPRIFKYVPLDLVDDNSLYDQIKLINIKRAKDILTPDIMKRLLNPVNLKVDRRLSTLTQLIKTSELDISEPDIKQMFDVAMSFDSDNAEMCRSMYNLVTMENPEIAVKYLLSNPDIATKYMKVLASQDWIRPESISAITKNIDLNDMDAINTFCDAFVATQKNPGEYLRKALIPMISGSVLGQDIMNGDIKPDISMTPERIANIMRFNNLSSSIPELKVRKSPKETYGDMFVRMSKSLQSVSVTLPDQRIVALDETEETIDRRTLDFIKTRNNKHGSAHLRIIKSWDANVVFPEYKEYADANPNRTVHKRMFHCTGSVAASMIMRCGFTIIPSSDESAVGRMLGDGIYFTNVIDKAQQYLGDSGYGRSYGTTGYVFEMEVQYTNKHPSNKLSLTTPQYDWAAAGISGRDNIRSPEWAVLDPKKQIKIYRVHKAVLVSPENINRLKTKYNGVSEKMTFLDNYLTEARKTTVMFTFGSGTVPVAPGKTQFFDRVSLKPGMQWDYSQQGPMLCVTNTLGYEGHYLIPDTGNLLVSDPEHVLPILYKLFS